MHRNHDFEKLRNVVKNNILKIRNKIVQLNECRRKKKQPRLATELREDIVNISSHIFGKHKWCKKRDHIYENVADTYK